jgi:hypothetical protein
MATKINVRSPFHIKVSQTNIATATLDLFVYTGTFVANASVANPKFSITKSVVTAGYITFEIAELVRDYLDITFDGTYTSQSVWVNAVIGTTVSSGGASATVTPDNTNGFIAFDGYGYFEDGINPSLSTTLLQSNKVIHRLNDNNTRIPIYTNGTSSVSYLNKGVVKRTVAITGGQTNTNAQVSYIDVFASANTDSYKERVLADGGTFEDNSLLDSFLDLSDIGVVDEIYINSASGTDVVEIKTEEECQYEVFKVTFVNKFGVLQDMLFRKKSVKTMATQNETFKANVVDFSSLTYSTSAHQTTQYNKSATQSLSLNTGFISEDNNDVIKELLLSEQLWLTSLDTTERVLGVIPKTSSVQYKTTLNDKLINYTIDFDFAFDTINTIR